MSAPSPEELLIFTPRQQAAFWSRVPLLHLSWPSHTGKSRTLAAWALYRLLTRPGWSIAIFCENPAAAARLATTLCEALRIRAAIVSGAGYTLCPRIGCSLRIRKATARFIRTCPANDLIVDDLSHCPHSATLIRAAEAWSKAHPQGCCRLAGCTPRSLPSRGG